MRFRLLECKHCHERTWTVDLEPIEHPVGDDWHEWWERYTFHAESRGPGLHPTQTGAVHGPTDAEFRRNLELLMNEERDR